jgi:two-component system sensor histidine kinase/response regulator
MSPSLAQADILIVDDQKENLDMLREILLEEGYYTRAVTSGKMALTAAQERIPDLVLLDVSMPGMSGFEVCERLREQRGCANVPVLFLTALHEPENKVLAFQVGGNDYITKPFHIEEVKARVRTHLGLYRLHQELQTKNDALEIAHQKLLKSEGLRDSLMAMIVHDLRAPLSGIVGSLRFMKEDAEAQEGRVLLSDLTRAAESSARLMLMINDLLDISRFEANQVHLSTSEFGILDLVSAVIQLIGPEKTPRLMIQAPPEDFQIQGDRHLLERVLLNLVDNAFKYSSSDGNVEVSFILEPDSWMLRVEDLGPGIPDEFKEKVFEKFGQVQARNAKITSYGLGLSFCKFAVEAHRGSVWMEDRVDRGTRAVVRIPRGDSLAAPALSHLA